MKLLTLLLFFVVGSSYSQSYEERTNPLAPIQSPPISNAEKEYLKTQKNSEPTIVKFGSDYIPLSENVKNYQHEQASQPLKDFKKKELTFNNFDSSSKAIDSPQPVQKSEKGFGIFGFLLGIIVVIITWISIPRSKGRRRKY